MKTLVLGASENTERYSNKAVRSLLHHQHEVLAIGKVKGQIENVAIETGFPEYKDVDTVTLYLNLQNQKAFYDYILKLKPRRIIFNPGAENPELEQLALANGIKVEEACTLVLLSIGAY